MNPEKVAIAILVVLVLVIVRGIFYMFQVALGERRESFRVHELERELALQSEFMHDLQKQTLQRIANQYSDDRAQGVLGCGCCHCDNGDDELKEPRPLNIHVSQPYAMRSSSRQGWQPSQAHDDCDDDEWGDEADVERIAYQQVPLLGKNWVGQLAYFNHDDVIDVPVDDEPPLEPLEPYEPPRKRGRPSKYSSQAEKQRAWRKRQQSH